MSTDSASGDDLQPGDLIVDVSSESTGQTRLELVACPVCGLDLEELQAPAVDDHIATHDPEEFGLDDDGYRYTPMADILIQLYGWGEEVDV
jgi:hypothetical protein